MKYFVERVSCRLFIFLVLAAAPFVSAGAQNVQIETQAPIAKGSHLWYEIKADPEEPGNLIICGTKWDAATNSPYGFVYASSNAGSTWRGVLEDRNSAWVTEHSCAFGAKHRAYFISEASKVIDGQPHHELGKTRLFVSTDAGEHWIETIKTGWADYSTSSVSSATNRLYTFFNATATRDASKGWGSSAGLLIFSPDGKHVRGPFFCPGMRELNYHGVYPADAVALKSGAVATLYYGVMETKAGREGELGILRAGKSLEPSLERTVIAHTKLESDCLNADRGPLAYDRERNRLFVVYVDGCKNTRIMLTSSDDEGRTWTRGAVIRELQEGDRRVRYPSLVVCPNGNLGFLWSELRGSSIHWFFAQVQNGKLVDPRAELPHGSETSTVSNDALWTAIYRSPGDRGENPGLLSVPSITVDVRSLENVVWRGSGLIAVGDKALAVWPSESGDGMRLDSVLLTTSHSVLNNESLADSRGRTDFDVTPQTAILYGGRQSLDSITGTLTVCMALTNRGNKSIRLPVKLEALDIKSPTGPASILNATNGLIGAGATWDISDSVTGDRIPPGATTNPFCLSIQVGGRSEDASPLEQSLLTLHMKVLSSEGISRERRREP